MSREKRIKKYILDRVSIEAMVDKEGLSRVTLEKERTRVAEKYNLEHLIGRDIEFVPQYPVGFEKIPKVLLEGIGKQFKRVFDVMEPEEIALLIGIPPSKQVCAIDSLSSSNYNWTISQLQRLADVLKVDLITLLKECMVNHDGKDFKVGGAFLDRKQAVSSQKRRFDNEKRRSQRHGGDAPRCGRR